MLKIRRAQMRFFSAAMQRSFELQMLAYVRTIFPSATEKNSDEEILRIIEDGIASASRYGIVGESDVQRYLKYMFIYGPDFDSNPNTAWAGEILRAEGVIGSKKMDRIDQYQRFYTNR